MNFMGKSKTNTGDGGSTRGAGGGGGGGGNSFEEEDEEERQNTAAPTGQLFPSSSSSSPSSSQHHHHHQYQHQQYQHQHQQHQPQPQPQPQNQNQNQAVVVPPFPPQNPYQNPRGSWSTDPPMMMPAPPPQDNNNNNNNNNNNDDDQQSSAGGGGGGGGMMMVVEREHMFDKVVTPSDVGKLNRLVIPKQHAERYFPLDSSTNDKGLLLNFEDRNGKPWRFRYSYWNSSQSYVMTKGWSRFVKDKKLDAGDIVSFQRGVGGSAKDRLFIDWRHRPDAPTHPPTYQSLSFPLPPHHQFPFPTARNANIHPWNPLFLQSQPVPSRTHSNLMLQSPSNYSHPSSYRYGGGPYHNIGTGSVVNVNQGGGSSGSVIYFRSGGGGGGGGIPHQQQIEMMQMQQRSGVGIDPPALPPPPPPGVVFESVPVVHGKAAAKRLRLFGVNMDCPISDDDDQDYDTTPIELSPTTASAGTTTNSIIPMGHYHQDHFSSHHHPPPSSSTIPYLQLRPYGGEETQFHQTTMVSSSSTDAVNKTTKSSSSDHMSLDLDM